MMMMMMRFGLDHLYMFMQCLDLIYVLFAEDAVMCS